MKISLLPKATDRHVSVNDATWDQLTKWFATHSTEAATKEDKKQVPLWSPIVWSNEYALIKNAVCVEPILVLDLDKCSRLEFANVLGELEDSGLTHFYYTTWGYSNPNEDPIKVRLLIQLSRRVQVHEWAAFWSKAVDGLLKIGGLVDRTCRGLDRAFFLPCHRPGVTPESARFDGSPLDVDLVLSLPDVDPLAGIEDEPDNEPTDLLPVPLDVIDDFSKRLSRKRGDRKVLGHYLKQVCKGEAFASSGTRDNTIFRLACVLAEEFPTADPSSIAVHFAASLSQMGADAPTVESVKEKIARKQREGKSARESDNKSLLSRIKQAFGGKRITPYSPEELEAFKTSGVSDGVASVPLDHRWILSDGSSSWFFVDGDYIHASAKATKTAARTYLAPAISAGVRTEFQDVRTGSWIDKDPEVLLKEYGQILRGVEYDLAGEKTYFDHDRGVLVLTAQPPRPLAPKRHADVEEWLSILGGEQLPHLLDWIATIRHLREPAPALLLHGHAGSGKNLLALGLSRLWSEIGPTDLDSFASSFNDAILSCPLVFGDERIPKNNRGLPDTETLRKLITLDSFPLRRKYQNESRVLGSVRILIATQTIDRVFGSGQQLTRDDIRAIADRFIVIKTSEAARSHLTSLGGRLTTDEWVKGDKIAEHALWLEQTLSPARGQRLIVPGNAGDLVRYLQVDSGVRWRVFLWVYEWLRDPKRHSGRCGTSPRAIDLRNGEIVIDPVRLVQCWDHYLPEKERAPALEYVIRDLREITSARGRWRALDLEQLLAWADVTEGREAAVCVLQIIEDGFPAEDSPTALGGFAVVRQGSAPN